MAKARKAQRSKGFIVSADAIGPTPQLAQHTPLEMVDIRDKDGWPVSTQRTVDTLGRLMRNGLIGPAEVKAGNWFRARFHISKLDPNRVPQLDRIFLDGGKPPASSESERIQEAKDDIWAALQAVGTFDSLPSRILYDVVGREVTISEWVQNQSFGGFRVRADTATGILAAALVTLAAHCAGLERNRQAEGSA